MPCRAAPAKHWTALRVVRTLNEKQQFSAPSRIEQFEKKKEIKNYPTQQKTWDVVMQIMTFKCILYLDWNC